ncbi:Trp biosynthesis-associated membrane protein [Leucobacter sp. USHLN153]|uniref:Trp biosynthesis-associated membrane protein n=1 Tax=Leucobacter sp. USHLN153 TaxID=3081268 RepID=UPI0030187D66
MRPKLLTITGIALAGALGLLAGSQTWVSFMVDGTHSLETVAGHDVNAALSPIAIATVAAALALTIAGPIFRRVLGALVVLLGGGLAALTISVIAAPLAAISGTVTTLTGISGADTTSLVVWSDLSAWVWVSAIAGVVAALLGLTVVVFGGRWVSGGRKYDSGSAAPAATASSVGAKPDRISDWDALSGGDDPSDGEDISDGGSGEAGGARG